MGKRVNKKEKRKALKGRLEIPHRFHDTNKNNLEVKKNGK